MDLKTVEKDVEKIIEKYWHNNNEYYSEYRYDENKTKFSMVDELQEYMEKNNIDFKIFEEDGFDSPGYGNGFMAIAYKVNYGNNFGSQLGLKTVVFEYM